MTAVGGAQRLRDETHRSEENDDGEQRPRRPHPGFVAAAVALLVVAVYGGYGHHWPWTGINGHTATLWDWLHLVLLPLAVAILPIWLRPSIRLGRPHRTAGMALLSAFCVLVLVGYTVPWAWTGFVGNTMWDWLNLLALPLAVSLAPVYGELRASWSRRHTAVALSALAVLLVPVFGGYVGGWTWTGFHGNTLWDWLHLLLLPLLLPTLVVPAFKPLATAGLIELEEARPDGGAPADGHS